MSKVYMRNSKNMMIKKVFRIGAQSKGKMTEMTQLASSWEAIRPELDADSLLHSSQEVSIEDDETLRRYSYHEDRGHSPHFSNIPNIPARKSTASLIWACEQGNSDVIKDLLFGGLDIHARCTGLMYSGYKAIHVAALYGHINVMQTLLDYSADVEEKDAVGERRPLHFAAGSHQTSMVRFLIGRGAQVDAKARNAVQPIHEASWSGSVEAIDALLEAGAAIDCSDRLGYQPLHWATLIPNQPAVIKYLSNKKADVNAQTNDGLRAIHLTCRADATNLGILLALGAKTNYDDGTDPILFTAINSESKFAVKTLLRHGVDPNRQASDGSTALHVLAKLRSKTLGKPSNDKEVCQLLLDHGANVHIGDRYGNHVLHCLASCNFTSMADLIAMEELAKLVLDGGADLNAATGEGYGPLYLAIYGGNRQLSRLLIRYGSRLLIRTEAIVAEMEVKTPELQMLRYWYTVNVWRYSRSIKQQWKRLPYLTFKLSVDDDGYITKSAMKETSETLELLVCGSRDSSSF